VVSVHHAYGDWLVGHGADVNAQNPQLATALLQAGWFHRIARNTARVYNFDVAKLSASA
jgi:hypothetical protein